MQFTGHAFNGKIRRRQTGLQEAARLLDLHRTVAPRIPRGPILKAAGNSPGRFVQYSGNPGHRPRGELLRGARGPKGGHRMTVCVENGNAHTMASHELLREVGREPLLAALLQVLLEQGPVREGVDVEAGEGIRRQQGVQFRTGQPCNQGLARGGRVQRKFIARVKSEPQPPMQRCQAEHPSGPLPCRQDAHAHGAVNGLFNLFHWAVRKLDQYFVVCHRTPCVAEW